MILGVDKRLESLSGTMIIARREIRDHLRDWRILAPIAILTLFFPLLMNFTAQQAMDFVTRYGAPIIGERLIPFLLMIVGFFPISISLVIALESFAGERERLSLEPLLATPLTDGQLYLGKMIASLVPPLSAAYLGIFVYLLGLILKTTWRPEPQLLLQILALTTVQAIVMVSGAVVISSQTTSVRAANLLASFIIVPVAELIILESMIMFWGRYHVLWWIVLMLVLIALVLGRMGLRLFNREELLGNEIDTIDLRWAWRKFWEAFRDGARTPIEWYRDLLTRSLSLIKAAALITAGLLFLAYLIGYRFAGSFTLPAEIVNLEQYGEGLESQFRYFGLFTGQTWRWVFVNNVRALALATLFGAFTLGVLAEVVLMASVGIVGYFAGNVALAGGDALKFLTALVLPHAVLEIPAVVLAGATILRLGLAVLSVPKGESLSEGWIKALAEWARIGLGLVLPLLLAAAAIEVFVTPRVAMSLLTG
ncbi:MAG TPA: ABC transporter permease subunit [Anaerolineae bacterium]|nr:ABC transporter permease subunit [Anaerolineae bacterium]